MAPRKSPADGVLVDTWHYDAVNVPSGAGERPDDESDAVEVATRKVAIELRLVKGFAGAKPPLAVSDVKFLLVCKEIGFRVQGTDIEALKVAMWDKLDERFKVKWERWLLVRVDRHDPYEGYGAGLVFSVQHVERGTAFDGTHILRERRRYDREYAISPWPEQFKEKNGRTLACIPDTPQNAQALEEFSGRIHALRKHLAEFVKPDRIMQTLANINDHIRMAALPAPPDAGSGEGDD